MGRRGFFRRAAPKKCGGVLKGIDARGKIILDIGCGTGGVEVVLVQELGAGRVIGIDVEPLLVERTRQRVEAAGVSERVDVLLVEPGPLQFTDDTFDIVFSKDSIAHIADKSSLFKEVFRVLRPGGWFAASDWLASEKAESSPEWHRLVELARSPIEVNSRRDTEQALKRTGFTSVTTVDRSSWYAPIAAEEVERLKGPLRARILKIVDETTFDHWLEMRCAMRDAVGASVLGPTLIRGFKPG